jgi:hypothetical protein
MFEGGGGGRTLIGDGGGRGKAQEGRENNDGG